MFAQAGSMTIREVTRPRSAPQVVFQCGTHTQAYVQRACRLMTFREGHAMAAPSAEGGPEPMAPPSREGGIEEFGAQGVVVWAPRYQ